MSEPGDSKDKAIEEEALPEDLLPEASSEEYEFPDVRRRAYGGVLVLLASCAGLVSTLFVDDAYINGGLVAAALLGCAAGVYVLASSWRLRVSEKDAILKAAAALSFPLGPASISIGWRGLLSRPYWRVLAYSPEEPVPQRRGYVAIDAVSGEVIDRIDEPNPESDWLEEQHRGQDKASEP